MTNMTFNQAHAMRLAVTALQTAMNKIPGGSSEYTFYRQAQHALLVELRESILDSYAEIAKSERHALRDAQEEKGK